MTDPDQCTRLLERLHDSSDSAARELLPLIYDELRALAGNYLGDQRRNHTLQPTALVHEAYMRMARGRDGTWSGRDHFFAVAAMAMRQILIDHARRKGSLKRGGDRQHVTLDEAISPELGSDIDLVRLDEALRRLAEFDERKSQVVTLRFFGGLTGEATARVLGVSRTTVADDWAVARAWLANDLSAERAP